MRPRYGTKYPERNEAICQAFNAGMRMASLARRYGLSPSMIKIILCRAGMRPWTMRPHVRTLMWRHVPPTPEKIAAIETERIAREEAEAKRMREKAASLEAVMNAVFPLHPAAAVNPCKEY
jgi:transposase-like protein